VAVFDHDLPIDDDGIHLVSARGVHEIWRQVAHGRGVDWRERRTAQIHEHDVGTLALLERADLVVPTERRGAFDGGHAQHAPGRHCLWIRVRILFNSAVSFISLKRLWLLLPGARSDPRPTLPPADWNAMAGGTIPYIIQ
jgi:hypothetical protein